MTDNKTLYDKLSQEDKDLLHEHAEQYTYSYGELLRYLKSNYYIMDLTLSQAIMITSMQSGKWLQDIFSFFETEETATTK